jgi:Replication-relaxation
VIARVLGGVAPLILTAVVGAALLSMLASDKGPLGLIRESVERGDIPTPRKEPRREPTRQARERDIPPPDIRRLLDERRSLATQVATTIWRAVRVPVLLTALGLAGMLALRLRARLRRRYVRHWLMPYRADEASPDQVRRLIESWHQMTLRRWWQRLLSGQPSFALELHAFRGDGGNRVRLMLACPDEPGLADALDGRLVACYRDTRLVAGERALDSHGVVVRLKKRRSFTTRLETPDRYDQSLIDGLVATMSAAGESCTVQYALTPAPASFDRFARWLFRSEERQLERARVRAEGGDPGVRSEVAQQELEGGLELQHRPLFFAELRVSAPSYSTARRVAGSIRGDSSGENRLVERRLRLRRRLYIRRMTRAIGNPLPSWSRGVVSSSELAGLWHLPSPFVKGVRIERSSVPRVPAPPEICCVPAELALVRDEHGDVAIADRDKRMNAMLLGAQGTGKTSVMCRGIAADVADPNCAVVVLDGKSDLALKALSVIPEDLDHGRRVHFLDFAHPEIGIDPFTADADRDAVADAIVEAFKEVHEEGSIQASSDRYLRQAAIACMGWVERTGQERATLWDMWTILLPSAEDFRREVVRAIGRDTELAAAAMFFGEQLPDQLHAARGQFVPRLDAPVNKLQKLTGQPKLDAILRHPLSLSIDEVIRNRDVLVVSGAVGSFGEGSARVLLQFILHMVHRALIRQQELPESERARVALKVDEAHLLFSPTFARMLAMDRSAGLECVAAWQSLGQIEDRQLRSVILNLLRHRFVFSVADDDARQLADMLQTVYADVMRDDQPARRRTRVSPDALMHLPNFHAACSWIAGGARVPSFIAQTLPMEENAERIEAHLRAQRYRGAHYPGPIPPPNRLAGYTNIQDLVPREKPDPSPASGVGRTVRRRRACGATGGRTSSGTESAGPTEAVGNDANGDPRPSPMADTCRSPASPKRPSGDRDVEIPDFLPERSSVDDQADRIGVAPLGTPTRTQVPDSYTELDEFDDPTGLRWQERPKGPYKPPLPRKDDLEVLAALHELRFLTASEIGRRFMPGRALRSVQHRLGQMFRVGWVRRCEITTGNRGHTQRVYALDQNGYELIQSNRGRTELARLVDPDAKWRPPEVEDPRVILHDLHTNAWLFAFERRVARNVLRGWRGPHASRLEVPGEKVRGQWVPINLDTVPLGTGHHLADLQLDEFRPVRPDLAIELDLSLGDQRRRVELLVELDRSGRASSNYDKFRRYDALLNGWAMAVPRYKALGEPPIVVFVVEDDHKATQFLSAADRIMTGRVGKWGVPEAAWPAYGRRRTFVLSERDVHQGTLRARRLPEHPPALRKALRGRRADGLEPEQVASLLPPAFLR